MSARDRWWVGALTAALLAGCGGEGAGGAFGGPGSGVDLGAATVLAAGRELEERAGGRVYVPIYSHVYHSDSAASYNLSATLSIRNADATRPIFVRTVEYFDVRGKKVRDYLERPIEVPPMAVAEFYLRESDTTGGSGASFVVDWAAEVEGIQSPVVQAVMIGTTGAQGISFVTEGVPLGAAEEPPARP